MNNVIYFEDTNTNNNMRRYEHWKAKQIPIFSVKSQNVNIIQETRIIAHWIVF